MRLRVRIAFRWGGDQSLRMRGWWWCVALLIWAGGAGAQAYVPVDRAPLMAALRAPEKSCLAAGAFSLTINLTR